jgi:hypothetical protein
MLRTSDTGKPKALHHRRRTSGLATIKAFADRSVPFECFEKSGKIGEVWAFGNSSSALACSA